MIEREVLQHPTRIYNLETYDLLALFLHISTNNQTLFFRISISKLTNYVNLFRHAQSFKEKSLTLYPP